MRNRSIRLRLRYFLLQRASETTFSLYEDAGTDLGYLRGEFMRTPITCQTTDKGYTLKVGTRTGEKYSLPGQRNLMFCIYTEQMPNIRFRWPENALTDQ